MAAAAINANNPIANLNGRIVIGQKEYRGNTFTYTIYYNPHELTYDNKEDIIKIFGNRIQKGEHCLGITEKLVRDNIKKDVYDALIHVKNNDIDDSATGALQYRAYCAKNLSKQLWISDLCRVNNAPLGSPPTSPISVLLNIIEELSKENNINENYLMVDKDLPGVTEKYSTRGKTNNQIENEKRKISSEIKIRNDKQAQIDKLTLVYTKYGFKTDEKCIIKNMKAMKKSLLSNTGLAKNRNRQMNTSGGKKRKTRSLSKTRTRKRIIRKK
jgi:hypothetical protein